MKTLLKKILISFLIIAILSIPTLTLFTPSAKAQTWYNPTLAEFVDKVFDQNNPDEIFGERYTYAQIVWIINSIQAIILPDFIVTCMTVSSITDFSAIAACIQDSIIALLPLLGYSPGPPTLASTFEYITASPLSGIGYIKNATSRLHLIPQAQAQQTGYGFEQLSSIQQIWRAVRNIAYLLMVVAFVIVAFMVMFRTKTSPQTAITFQSALPRLIIILLLVTFSFAISGLLIDLTYLSLGLWAVLIKSSPNITSLGTIELYNALLSARSIFAMFIVPFLFLVLSTAGGFIFSWTGIGVIVGFISSVLLLILLIFFLIIWLRIFWLMFKNFVSAILLIIASPIMILLGIFPAFGGFGSWLKTLVSHLAVFPTIIIMMFLAHFFFWSSLGTDVISNVFRAIPTLNPYGISLGASGGGAINLPGFPFGTGATFGFIVSASILFLVPSIGNIIQSTISGRPFAYGTAIGEALAIPGATVGFGTKLVAGAGEWVQSARTRGWFAGKGKAPPSGSK